MRPAIGAAPGATPYFPPPVKAFPPWDEVNLRETLKGCSAATHEAACEFRKTGDTRLLPAIIHGIIERYVETGRRAALNAAADELRLEADLGIDSLSLMEIMILTEDVLQLSIKNEELRPLRTVGDVRRFLAGRLRAGPLPKPAKLPANIPNLAGATWPRGQP